MYLLVTFKDNYADEFDIAGFKIFKSEAWEELAGLIRDELENKKEREWYFGSNEFIIFETYGDRPLFDVVMKKFIVKEIDQETCDKMIELFPTLNYGSFGFFPTFGF